MSENEDVLLWEGMVARSIVMALVLLLTMAMKNNVLWFGLLSQIHLKIGPFSLSKEYDEA